MLPPALALAFALVVSLVTGAAAAPSDSARPLVPPPAPTAVVGTWSAVPPGTAMDKPLPKSAPLPAPRLPPPMSPPLAGTPQGGGAPASATVTSSAPSAPPDTGSKDAQAKDGRNKEERPKADHRDLAGAKDEPVIRYAATEINVRPRPDQEARRIDVIDEGTRLEVIGPLIQNEWVKVARHGRVLGYVSADYLLPRPPKPH